MFDHDLLTAQERHTALQNEADNWRLAKLARAGMPRHTQFHSRLLDQLGRSLVAWGWRLRVRYGNLETIDIRRSEA